MMNNFTAVQRRLRKHQCDDTSGPCTAGNGSSGTGCRVEASALAAKSFSEEIDLEADTHIYNVSQM
jgi:hypothetical protein